jgi:hypothetical protein
MVKTVEEYVGFLKSEYPDIPEEVLKEIIVSGCKQMQRIVHKDHDFRISNKSFLRTYSMTIVRPCKSIADVWARARINLVRLIKFRDKRNYE